MIVVVSQMMIFINILSPTVEVTVVWAWRTCCLSLRQRELHVLSPTFSIGWSTWIAEDELVLDCIKYSQ